MPLGDVLELNFVLYVPNLMKSFLSISYTANLQCLVEFDGQQTTIKDSVGICVVEHNSDIF
jgi:hypothetical protein